MKITAQSALILVDIQNDFLPGGALAVPQGDQVIEVANRLMPAFECVVATQDWHPADHSSFASQHADHEVGQVIQLDGLSQVLWPDHCVEESRGAEFATALQLPNHAVVFKKGTDKQIDSYSGFFDNGKLKSTGLDKFLQQQNIRRVFVLGLATDYCVKFTACDAAELGLETVLIEDGCRGVDLQSGDVDVAIAQMRTSGIHVLQSNQIA